LDEKITRLFVVSFAAFFMNVVAPSAGVSGAAVFISSGRQKNHSPAKVAVAYALFVLFDYIGFLLVLMLGLAVLARRNRLSAAEISASVILLIIALALTILLYLGARSARSLGKVLALIARVINSITRPFIHREYLSTERAYSFAEEASEGIQALRKDVKNWLKPLILAVNNKAILIIILAMVFLAFRVPFSAGTLIAGFSIGNLFLIISPTPSGIGFFEGALTLSLTSLHVPLEAAGVITLAYRGITFWLPLVFGMGAMRLLPDSKRQ
jgi:uncharacterized protein (TIRG00374 family)